MTGPSATRRSSSASDIAFSAVTGARVCGVVRHPVRRSRARADAATAVGCRVRAKLPGVCRYRAAWAGWGGDRAPRAGLANRPPGIQVFGVVANPVTACWRRCACLHRFKKMFERSSAMGIAFLAGESGSASAGSHFHVTHRGCPLLWFRSVLLCRTPILLVVIDEEGRRRARRGYRH
jgi:hypothetical protein